MRALGQGGGSAQRRVLTCAGQTSPLSGDCQGKAAANRPRRAGPCLRGAGLRSLGNHGLPPPAPTQPSPPKRQQGGISGTQAQGAIGQNLPDTPGALCQVRMNIHTHIDAITRAHAHKQSTHTRSRVHTSPHTQAVHTNTLTRTHEPTQTSSPHKHTRSHMHTRTHTSPYTQAVHTNTLTLTHSHTSPRTQAGTRALTCTRADTHSHAHVHTMLTRTCENSHRVHTHHICTHTLAHACPCVHNVEARSFRPHPGGQGKRDSGGAS